MSKGLRLSYFGVKCSVQEVEIMTHTLGYNSNPVFNGWGTGGYRNFFGANNFTDNSDFRNCKSLTEKGLMYEGQPNKLNELITYFGLTEFGKQWFRAFKRQHPHADWKQKK